MNNKATIIIICASCLLLTLIIACSRGCSSKEKEKQKIEINKQIIKETPEKKIKEKNKEDNLNSNTSSYSNYSSGGSGEEGKPPTLYTESELAERAKKIKKQKERISNLKKEYLNKRLNDPDLSIEAREQLKLRSNPSFFNGMKAFKSKDYQTAIKSFSEILKDNGATPLTKYFACWNLMQIARETGDFDLFFIAARTRALIIAKEDLSILEIPQNNDELKRVEEIENSLRAINDPKYIEICIKNKVEGLDEVTEADIDNAKEDVLADIEYYSNKYKELIK